MAGDGWDEELDVEFQLPKGGTQRVAVHTLFLNSPNLIRSLLPQNGKNEDALEHPISPLLGGKMFCFAGDVLI